MNQLQHFLVFMLFSQITIYFFFKKRIFFDDKEIELAKQRLKG